MTPCPDALSALNDWVHGMIAMSKGAAVHTVSSGMEKRAI